MPFAGTSTTKGLGSAGAAKKKSVRVKNPVGNASAKKSGGSLTASAKAKAKDTRDSRDDKHNHGSGHENEHSGQSKPKKHILIKWHDVEFYANAKEVRGLTDFSISGSVETEDKENGGSKYVSKKNSKGYEASIKAFFDARLGIKSVKGEAMKLVEYAAKGQTGHLHAEGSRLIPSLMMLTDAKADNVIMTPRGKWISCEVSLTLKMCSKLDGTTETPSTGYKYSVKVYYSASSGAVKYVIGYSNISKEDARKKAWAKVPSNAQWASENYSDIGGTNPDKTPNNSNPTQPTGDPGQAAAEATQAEEDAKTESENAEPEKPPGIDTLHDEVESVKDP